MSVFDIENKMSIPITLGYVLSKGFRRVYGYGLNNTMGYYYIKYICEISAHIRYYDEPGIIQINDANHRFTMHNYVKTEFDFDGAYESLINSYKEYFEI